MDRTYWKGGTVPTPIPVTCFWYACYRNFHLVPAFYLFYYSMTCIVKACVRDEGLFPPQFQHFSSSEHTTGALLAIRSTKRRMQQSRSRSGVIFNRSIMLDQCSPRRPRNETVAGRRTLADWIVFRRTLSDQPVSLNQNLIQHDWELPTGKSGRTPSHTRRFDPDYQSWVCRTHPDATRSSGVTPHTQRFFATRQLNRVGSCGVRLA